MTAGQHLELGSEVAAEITTGPPGRSTPVSPSPAGWTAYSKRGTAAPHPPNRPENPSLCGRSKILFQAASADVPILSRWSSGIEELCDRRCPARHEEPAAASSESSIPVAFGGCVVSAE